tara:strand:- start:1329 stop:1949 length:621 start_codon:yes stop_codon:yes gene_type:complete
LKKKKESKNWFNKNKRDYFFKQSKIKGYRSRSAFKLIEIDSKFKFLKRNSRLLDLGSSPGGWSQVASKKINNGKILAIDIIPMEKVNNVNFLKGDVLDERIHDEIVNYFKGKVDIVISDMAANTTGNKELDSYKTGQLCLNSMELAKNILSSDGVYLSKIFMGSIFKEVNEKAKEYFTKVVNFKPFSSKKESKETYIFCKGISKIL